MDSCYCGSGIAYSGCCEPFITGSGSAETAEQLMRARYSAYVGVQMDFIFQTTHPDHRKGYDHTGTKKWAENSEWQGLEIITTLKGGSGDTEGQVEFIARFSEKGEQRVHHENASFVRENGQWFFTDGRMVKPKPVTVNKVGRNDPCICGSGIKHKKCCGR
ncbi:MAG: YchJ family protein [Desulfuromonadales bacterium]